MASGFFILSDTLTPSLAAVDVMAEEEDAVLEYAEEIKAYAQANAPWSDRTGDARAGLDVSVDQEGTSVVLELYHTVDYGLYLEVKNSGELAIIMPTLEHFAGDMFASLGVEMIGEDLTQ